MNEKSKKIVISLAIVFFVMLIVIQSVADNIIIRRADTQINALTEQLGDAQSRLVSCQSEIRAGRNTIRECSNSIGRITDGLEEQSTELSSIIANLKQVRAEVEIMENALDKFYDEYGYYDFGYNNIDKEVEQ